MAPPPLKLEMLMCPPDFFRVEYAINPWMDPKKSVNVKLAQRQWRDLKKTFERLGVMVHALKPDPKLPDMVFTANAGLVKDHTFIPAHFRHPQRQGEERHYAAWFRGHRYQIAPIAQTGFFFEGCGDGLFHGTRLWLGHGWRSTPGTAKKLTTLLHMPVHLLKLTNPKYYHLDTCFAPLDRTGYAALYYPGAFDAKGRALLKQLVPVLIPVSTQDAEDFACNSITIGKTVVLYRASGTLKTRLKQEGFRVIEMDMTEFMKSGGSVRCLTLFLPEN